MLEALGLLAEHIAAGLARGAIKGGLFDALYDLWIRIQTPTARDIAPIPDVERKSHEDAEKAATDAGVLPPASVGQ